MSMTENVFVGVKKSVLLLYSWSEVYWGQTEWHNQAYMSPTDVQERGKPLFKQAAYCVRPINHSDNVSLQFLLV